MAELDRSTRNRALIALALFLGITLSLTWIWLNGGGVLYGKLFRLIGSPVYELFGIHDVSVRPRLRYANHVPFLGLLAATPGLRWAEKFRFAVIGVAILFVSHLVLNLSASEANHYQFTPVAKLIADGSPILLWAFLCRNALAPLGAMAFRVEKGVEKGKEPDGRKIEPDEGGD